MLKLRAEPGFYISLLDFFEILSIDWDSPLRRGFYQEWEGRAFGRVPSLAFKRVGPRALDLWGFGQRRGGGSRLTMAGRGKWPINVFVGEDWQALRVL